MLLVLLLLLRWMRLNVLVRRRRCMVSCDRWKVNGTEMLERWRMNGNALGTVILLVIEAGRRWWRWTVIGHVSRCRMVAEWLT